ncbi:MAG: hypothetical protein FWC76_02825 [Defluviitaleaceae bacterium]|nr:hypothetical protein [Defluviitaleaceae bacterium]
MARNDKILVSSNHRQRPHYPDATAYYSTDSTARQIAEEHVPSYEPAPQPLPQPQRAPKKSRRTRREFVYDVQAKHRHNFLSYVLILAFFGGLAIILSLNARFEYNHMQMEAARNQLAVLQSTNDARASEIYATLNFEEIETIAIEQLGMMPPQDFQMVEIIVQPQSFFAHAPADNAVQSGFSLPRFWSILFSSDGQN